MYAYSVLEKSKNMHGGEFDEYFSFSFYILEVKIE